VISKVNIFIGPQHPSAHKISILVINLFNNSVYWLDVNIGYLHRGSLKLINCRVLYICVVLYLNRLDYVGIICQEYICVIVLELSVSIVISFRCECIRIVLVESFVILSHMLNVGCYILDLGSLLLMLWLFDIRDSVIYVINK